MRYLGNAFSLNMLGEKPEQSIRVRALSLTSARMLVGNLTSVVGHADAAAVFTTVLRSEVACNRASVTLEAGDSLLVGQYSGPRLPEGATKLPEGANIKWFLVEIN
jgi:hypothetical protein